MNVAIIFAGGSGKRMHTKDRPKQFLMVHGKPIIVHTLEAFQEHPGIDGITVSCIEGWIPYLEDMVDRYRLGKVADIVPGGVTGQLSIYAALRAAEARWGRDGVSVLVHDGVRPLIDAATISRCIEGVRERGAAITTVPAKETVVLVSEQGEVDRVVDRGASRIARAPQAFRMGDLLDAHARALAEGVTDSIDSCTLMARYGYPLSVVEGRSDNIKVTTPEDFYTFRAIYDARENDQLQ